MKHLTLTIAAIGCILSILISSCCKERMATKCIARLHGYTAPDSTFYGFALSPAKYGIINTTGGTMTPLGSFMGYMTFTMRATYNRSDNCYYVIEPTFMFPYLKGILNKIDAGGAVTTFVPVDSLPYMSVKYNRWNNKLYCLTGTGRLGELTVGAGSFSVTPVVTPFHLAISDITVDENTGDIYLQTVDTTVYNYYLEKYRPGASSTTMVAPLLRTFGMEFNKNDNMLYALQGTTSFTGFNFIKIIPATGAVTIVSLAPVGVSDFFSAVLDPCANRYIYSTLKPTMTGDVYRLCQLDMSGALVRLDTTATFYQGLAVEY